MWESSSSKRGLGLGIKVRVNPLWLGFRVWSCEYCEDESVRMLQLEEGLELGLRL